MSESNTRSANLGEGKLRACIGKGASLALLAAGLTRLHTCFEMSCLSFLSIM